MSLTEEFADTQDQKCIHLPPVEVDFDPQAWMRSNIIDSTGSYAYALNMPQLGEVKPGFVYFKPIMDDAINSLGKIYVGSADEMASRLDHDGLFYLGKALPERGHTIAFFGREPTLNEKDEVVSAHEVMCVRRDSNGGWSYRIRAGCPSPSLPLQTDWSGKPIRDIESANFGPYKKFFGYAGLPYEGLLYYPRLTLSNADLAPFTGLAPAIPNPEIAPRL